MGFVLGDLLRESIRVHDCKPLSIVFDVKTDVEMSLYLC